MKAKNIRLKTNEKISLIGNFSTMLSAGIPILEAVDSLLEDSKGNQRRILEVLREDLVQGKRVYSSFSKFPEAFDKVTTSVLRASEEAGTLDVALKDIRENIRKEAEFSDKIKSALVYPLFISIVFLGVLLMILFVVVPKISIVFGRLDIELPLATRALVFISNLLVNNGGVVLVGAVAFILAAAFFYNKNRKALLNIFFSFPLISRVVYRIDLTRFSRSLHLLLNSGLPITRALELAADVVIKKETEKMIVHSKEMVLAGKPLSEGFAASKKKMPAIMIRLVEAGEKTGTLDKSMQEISEHLDYEVSNSLKIITSLIEPIMLVLVGIVVGGMMMAVIAPIYGLISQVGAM